MSVKPCSRCKIVKSKGSFYVNKKTKDGLTPHCRDCQKRDLNKAKARSSKLLKLYGITAKEYEEFSDFCGGVCAICEQKETIRDSRSGETRRLAVDHDDTHPDKIIRGLLCAKHNRGIGMFNHNVDLLRNAILYLESYQEALKENGLTKNTAKDKNERL